MEHWPADQVERRALASLIPYARNARTHSDDQIGQLAASIREWGWTMPVLVDESGMIIAGHGRVLAAGRLGMGDVPVMVARGWSDAQKRAYVIADNGWDDVLLKLRLGWVIVGDLGPTRGNRDASCAFTRCRCSKHHHGLDGRTWRNHSTTELRDLCRHRCRAAACLPAFAMVDVAECAAFSY